MNYLDHAQHNNIRLKQAEKNEPKHDYLDCTQHNNIEPMQTEKK